MDILGISFQELAMAAVIAVVVAFQVRMLIDVWRGQKSTVFRLVWSGVIFSLPVAGAGLYWWFVKSSK